MVLLGGCASTYYRITDTEAGRSYDAQDYETNDAGALVFEDARTGKRVTVFNSEVEELTENPFENAVYRENDPSP